jgi:hypothetical protein
VKEKMYDHSPVVAQAAGAGWLMTTCCGDVREVRKAKGACACAWSGVWGGDWVQLYFTSVFPTHMKYEGGEGEAKTNSKADDQGYNYTET